MLSGRPGKSHGMDHRAARGPDRRARRHRRRNVGAAAARDRPRGLLAGPFRAGAVRLPAVGAIALHDDRNAI